MSVAALRRHAQRDEWSSRVIPDHSSCLVVFKSLSLLPSQRRSRMCESRSV